MFPWKKTSPPWPKAGPDAGDAPDDPLAMVPVRLVDVTEEILEDDRIRLCWQVRYRPGFASLLGRLGMWSDAPLRKRLELDVLGTASWRLLDGTRSVARAAAALAERFGLTRHETEAAMAAFVRQLGRRGIIGLASAKKEEEQAKRRNG